MGKRFHAAGICDCCDAPTCPGCGELVEGCDCDRDDWPVHQPDAPEAPIPGRHWYSGCNPDYPRVNPATGVCEDCGGIACRTCGRENCPDHTGRERDEYEREVAAEREAEANAAWEEFGDDGPTGVAAFRSGRYS